MEEMTNEEMDRCLMIDEMMQTPEGRKGLIGVVLTSYEERGKPREMITGFLKSLCSSQCRLIENGHIDTPTYANVNLTIDDFFVELDARKIVLPELETAKAFIALAREAGNKTKTDSGEVRRWL